MPAHQAEFWREGFGVADIFVSYTSSDRGASGDAGGALSLAETALAGAEKILGPDHPWTKSSADVTAKALDALGRGGEAAALRAKFGL
jgi:hypothetical protein